MIKRIARGYIIPSAAFTIPNRQYYHADIQKTPEVGDVVYGRVLSIGQHTTLENCYGRIHKLHDHTRAFFVYGNRYAPDHYESRVPTDFSTKVDLAARSGLIGEVIEKNEKVADPTQIKIIGFVCDKSGNILNTRKFQKVKLPRARKIKTNNIILSIGTSMNSGKTTTAAFCCWALTKAGHEVTATKVTGTASMKDILSFQDAGAKKILDFSYFGYPSTYLMEEKELLDLLSMCSTLNRAKYWVVELADGILQRETRMLLAHLIAENRIYKLLFNAYDAFSAISGIRILKEEFGVEPDAVSGVISGSPLLIQEFRQYSEIPVINNQNPRDFNKLLEVILC